MPDLTEPETLNRDQLLRLQVAYHDAVCGAGSGCREAVITCPKVPLLLVDTVAAMVAEGERRGARIALAMAASGVQVRYPHLNQVSTMIETMIEGFEEDLDDPYDDAS